MIRLLPLALCGALIALVGCGTSCEPAKTCTVTPESASTRCGCGRRYCPACQCNTPGCEALGGGPGAVWYFDCLDNKWSPVSCPAD